MKAVVYYEGESEKKMLDQILYKSCQPIHITEDALDFLTFPDDSNIVLCYPCEGAQNVFPYVAESAYLYENDEVIILLRDLETTPCFRLLNAELTDVCLNPPPGIRTRLVFSKPEFEEVYFADLALLRVVFIRLYEDHFGRPISNPRSLQDRIGNLDRNKPKVAIRELFRSYNMAYKKPKLANRFFTRFDFHGSGYPYIRRLVTALGDLANVPS